MANEDTEKTAEKPAPKGHGKLFIILALIIILAVAAAGYFLFFKKDHAKEDTAQQTTSSQPTAQNDTSATEPGPIQEYPTFLVNLADAGGNRYLRINVSLELSKEKTFQAEVVSKDPRIKDIILSILSSKTVDEINTTQGKIALKQEIMRRLNTIMTGGRIVDIYITEFVIQ